MRAGLQQYWRTATWLLVATVAFDLAHPLAAHCSVGTPLHHHQSAEETGHDSCGADEQPTPAGPAASVPHAGHATDCGCDGACLCHGQLTPATVAVLPTIAPVLRDVLPPRTAGPQRGSSSSVYRPPRG